MRVRPGDKEILCRERGLIPDISPVSHLNINGRSWAYPVLTDISLCQSKSLLHIQIPVQRVPLLRYGSSSSQLWPQSFCPEVMGCVYLFTVAYNELLPLSLCYPNICITIVRPRRREWGWLYWTRRVSWFEGEKDEGLLRRALFPGICVGLSKHLS